MSLTAFKVFITVTYKGLDAPAPHKTIRRFSAKQGTTLAEFRSILIEDILHRTESTVTIAVSYKDADGDVVEVSSELEWTEALQQHATSGTVPILINVQLAHPYETIAASPAVPIHTTTSAPEVTSEGFSPIYQSDEDDEDEYANSNFFANTESRASEMPPRIDDVSPQSEESANPDGEGCAPATSPAEEEKDYHSVEEEALAMPQPSTDALLMTNPSTDAPHDWEEVNADEEHREEIQREDTAEPEAVAPMEGDQSTTSTAAPAETESSQRASEIHADPTAAAHPSQQQQPVPPNPQHPQAQQQQQPQPGFAFLASPFAWLSQQAVQHLRSQPRGLHHRRNGANVVNGVPMAGRGQMAATVSRYQKTTGETKEEDIVRMLALCPAATAEQASEALDKYHGQVYRAANYLLDLTANATPAA